MPAIYCVISKQFFSYGSGRETATGVYSAFSSVFSYVFSLFALLFLTFSFIGCGPSRESIQPTTGLDSLQTLSAPGEVPLPQRWWEEFDDPQLEGLIDSALTRNFNLAAAWERFRQAQFVLKREKGIRWPQFEGGAQSAISRPQPDFAGSKISSSGPPPNTR